MKNKTYKMPTECYNCDSTVIIKIPKGTERKGYVTVCPYCGVLLILSKLVREEVE